VLFTVDPVTGNLAQMTGNFVPGLGEKLVSGQAERATFCIAAPERHYSGPPELTRMARDLYRTACGLEKELGGPQDIEWAIAADGWSFSRRAPSRPCVDTKPRLASGTIVSRATFYGPAPSGRKRASRAYPFLLLLAEAHSI